MFNPFRKKERFSDYVIDLGKLKSKSIKPAENSGTASSAGGDLGFLGTMATAASDSPAGYGSSSDETEKKMNSISERIYKILDRIDLIEHKIDRIERKIGLKDEY